MLDSGFLIHSTTLISVFKLLTAFDMKNCFTYSAVMAQSFLCFAPILWLPPIMTVEL